MAEIIDARKEIKDAASPNPAEEAPNPEEMSASEEGKEKPIKQIIITLDDNLTPEVKIKGMGEVEIFGAIRAAKRLIMRNIEFNEAMAMEAAARQRQELATVRSAIANTPQPKRPGK
jgi:hypothetical protein